MNIKNLPPKIEQSINSLGNKESFYHRKVEYNAPETYIKITTYYNSGNTSPDVREIFYAEDYTTVDTTIDATKTIHIFNNK